MAVSFHETQETIGILRRVADKLDKEHGCITADELWKGVQWYVIKFLNFLYSANPSVFC